MKFMLLNQRSVIDDEMICALFIRALNLYDGYSANEYVFYKMSFCFVDSKKKRQDHLPFFIKGLD